MNGFKQTMMNEPGDFIEDEASFKKERRILVIALYLSYLACIAGLWFVGDVLGSQNDILGQQIGNGRFVLLAVPLAVLCVCYLRLRRIMGEIMELSGKKLDERQRLVRDQAHRTAYKIIAILCLGVLVYFGIHSMLVPPQPVTTMIHTVSDTAQSFIVVSPNNVDLHAAVYWRATTVPTVLSVQSVQPIDLFGLGIYYGLFFLTIVLIVTTLPKAIIAWRVRG
jgi:hypothetical protein